MTNLAANFTDITRWTLLENISQLPTLLSPEQMAVLFDKNASPFTSFEFLQALELSQSIGQNTGWRSRYCLYQSFLETDIPKADLQETDEQKIGLFICYEKTHSYGEYVFDWAWANAYHQHGIDYYPKLLAAIPFTPVPCCKWLSNTEYSELEAFEVVKAVCAKDYSSYHYLFPTSCENIDEKNFSDKNNEAESNWIKRSGHQFHWFNQDEELKPLSSFEQYLSLMTARKRKNILKERNKITQAGLEFEWKYGKDLTEHEFDTFYQCYQSTYQKRGQHGYLSHEFFAQICQTLPEQCLVLCCYEPQSGQMVAGAWYFCSNDTLYGRYWGAIIDYELLHFEACYYQGIEYAIAHGLKCFNPGTQGEHKISRGFRPTHTYSYHQLTLEPFHQAVENFCRQEQRGNDMYMKECEQRLPFKQQG